MGLRGVFFKAENPEKLYEWYEKHLGINRMCRDQEFRFAGKRMTIRRGSPPGRFSSRTQSIFS
jgi:hypothetical protein